MQPDLNNDNRSFPSVKGKGLIATTLVHLGLFLLLLLVTFSAPAPPESGEGILVNFGTGETGLGDIEPSPPPGIKVTAPPPQPVQKKASPPPATTAEKKSKAESLLSQDKEEAPEVKKVDPAVEKKKRET
jgi:protein TonB